MFVSKKRRERNKKFELAFIMHLIDIFSNYIYKVFDKFEYQIKEFRAFRYKKTYRSIATLNAISSCLGESLYK